MTNVLDKSFLENKNTVYVQYLFPENRTVCEIMSKNAVETEGPQMTSQYGAYAFACWISKATCTYAYAHAYAPGYPYARTHARTQAQACTQTIM
jgi:hypothetical protein